MKFNSTLSLLKIISKHLIKNEKIKKVQNIYQLNVGDHFKMSLFSIYRTRLYLTANKFLFFFYFFIVFLFSTSSKL